MLVTDDALVGGRDLAEMARAAAAGGATSLQLRLKRTPTRELLELARVLVAQSPIPLLVNDRPDIALAAGAAGAHLGPEDLPVSLARRFLPPGFVLGASVGSEEEAAQANDADYWGIGPWRVTGTKPDAGSALGAAGFHRLVVLARGRPCLAIGSVVPEDAKAVRGAGGAGVAVASGILRASDVEAATRRYGDQWRVASG